MVVLDTHIWIWWIHANPRLPARLQAYLDARQTEVAVSAISCWEVAKLVAAGRVTLSRPIDEWFSFALAPARVRLIELSPSICIESTRLPGSFHRDPADQIIVATARIFDCPLLTLDGKILDYPQVRAFSSPPNEAEA